MNHTIASQAELQIWAGNFIDQLVLGKQASIVTLRGDLGSGKTTLVQCIAKVLGIDEPVTSPTFVIQKEYTVDEHPWINRLVHIDAYRLEGKDQLEYLGWCELVDDPHTLVCIEWPEMVEGIALPGALQLTLRINTDQTRTLQC